MQIYASSRFARSYLGPSLEGRRSISDRIPFRYQPFVDNIRHVPSHYDTASLAALTPDAPLPRPCGYWWAIADFQPDPIINPLLTLCQNRQAIIVPSLRVLTDMILRLRFMH